MEWKQMMHIGNGSQNALKKKKNPAFANKYKPQRRKLQCERSEESITKL